MNRKLAIYCDFDGTITERDVIDAFLERFASADWMAIEENWKLGKISSRDCLRQQLKCVPALAHPEIEEFLKEIKIDPYFLNLLNYSQENAIPFYIVSDGFDWFIQSVLRNNGIENLPLFSNVLRWTTKGLIPSFPLASQSCRTGSGVCKCKVVEASQENYFKIYIGDGRSDFCVAPSADLLFAKGSLKHYCETQRIEYRDFTSFRDVMAVLEPLVTDRARMRLGQPLNSQFVD
jgi:2,3-diketo-5-methylthio-1-phosphopentane phosphatase